MNTIQFTHYWVTGFGWSNTIFQEEDFVTVELLGHNNVDGSVFLGIYNENIKCILKGKYTYKYYNQPHK